MTFKYIIILFVILFWYIDINLILKIKPERPAKHVKIKSKYRNLLSPTTSANSTKDMVVIYKLINQKSTFKTIIIKREK